MTKPTLPALYGLAIALSVAACAQKGPPPAVSLEGRSCVEEPDLASAHAVVLGGDAVKVTLDGGAACWQPVGQASGTYAVFALPPAGDPYMVSVTSTPLGEGLFSPRILMLDEQGKVARELPRDAFLFHGAALRAGLRIHTGEHYLIVVSDPASVGQQVSQIASGIQTTTVATATLIGSYRTGFETQRTMTYAYNGTIVVSAEPIPQAH